MQAVLGHKVIFGGVGDDDVEWIKVIKLLKLGGVQL